MKRVTDENLNSIEYWDEVYHKEGVNLRRRVDDRRLLELLRWIRVRRHELQRFPSVLDVGCGLGEVSRFLLQSYSDMHVAGIDISSEAVEFCHRFASSPNAKYELGSAICIPFPDESYDITWCGETIEHVEDPDVAIEEMKRVTNEGGFIVISTPYRGRNRSPEHVWEFDPDDVARWGKMCGELVFLDCSLLPGWISMFAVLRRATRTDIS
jgi:SAM-dependent methyltransferase